MSQNTEQKNYDPDAYMAREHLSPNVANTEQNVRTRDEQVDALYHGRNTYLTITQDDFRYELVKAEYRGAAEQRRKDAEERDRTISHLRQLVKSYRACGWFRTSKAISRTLKSAYGVHYGPGEWERELPDSIQSVNMTGPGTVHALIANVAALEARVKELEEAFAPLLEACEVEMAGPGTEEYPDSESVATTQSPDGEVGESPITFGMIRTARAALTREGGV